MSAGERCCSSMRSTGAGYHIPVEPIPPAARGRQRAVSAALTSQVRPRPSLANRLAGTCQLALVRTLDQQRLLDQVAEQKSTAAQEFVLQHAVGDEMHQLVFQGGQGDHGLANGGRPCPRQHPGRRQQSIVARQPAVACAALPSPPHADGPGPRGDCPPPRHGPRSASLRPPAVAAQRSTLPSRRTSRSRSCMKRRPMSGQRPSTRRTAPFRATGMTSISLRRAGNVLELVTQALVTLRRRLAHGREVEPAARPAVIHGQRRSRQCGSEGRRHQVNARQRDQPGPGGSRVGDGGGDGCRNWQLHQPAVDQLA